MANKTLSEVSVMDAKLKIVNAAVDTTIGMTSIVGSANKMEGSEMDRNVIRIFPHSLIPMEMTCRLPSKIDVVAFDGIHALTVGSIENDMWKPAEPDDMPARDGYLLIGDEDEGDVKYIGRVCTFYDYKYSWRVLEIPMGLFEATKKTFMTTEEWENKYGIGVKHEECLHDDPDERAEEALKYEDRLSIIHGIAGSYKMDNDREVAYDALKEYGDEVYAAKERARRTSHYLCQWCGMYHNGPNGPCRAYGRGVYVPSRDVWF